MPVPQPVRPKLRAAQARPLVGAEMTVKRLEALLTVAKEARGQARNKARRLVTEGVEHVGAQHTIKRATSDVADSFSLSAYLKAGHELTPEMREFVTKHDTKQERWTVKPVEPDVADGRDRAEEIATQLKDVAGAGVVYGGDLVRGVRALLDRGVIAHLEP